MPACNGSVAAEKGPFQVIGVIDEAAKSAGTVPCANAGSSPDASPEAANPAENRRSLPGDCGAEKLREGNVRGRLS